MKRREMIVWLANRIDEENGESFKINTADLDNLGAIAEFVIDMVEEKGMKPPTREITYKPLPSKTSYVITSTWEDE